MWRPASVLVVALVIVACAPPPVTTPRTATPSIIVVPTELPNGRVEIAADLSPGRAGSPAEVLVRRLDARAATASAGRRATTSVTWDGEDEFGVRVPADAYVLLLEFESNDGGSTRTVRATATLQMND